MSRHRTIPTQRGLPFLGHALRAARDPLSFLADLPHHYPDIVRVKLGSRPYLIVQSPEICRHILTADPELYMKPGAAKEMKRFLGEGLATSNGPLWRRQRKLIQPAFHGSEVDRFISVLDNVLDNMTEQWALEKGSFELNINESFLRLTLSNITQTMFGTNLGENLDSTAEVISDLLTLGTKRVTSMFKLPAYIPSRSNIAFKKARLRFDEIVFDFIDSRIGRKKPSIHSDVLDVLLNAKDADTGESMSRTQLRDEVATIFMAGHETTAQTLSWCFYQLAVNQEVQDIVRQETSEVPYPDVSMQELKRLNYSRQLIDETLRFYPPVWVIARGPVHDDILPGNYQVKPGDILLANVYGMHRNQKFWRSPDTFDPRNFDPGLSRARPAYTFLGFGGGSRICIGSQFAVMVMLLTISRLLSRFRFTVKEGFTPKVVAGLTLRAKYGIPLIVSPY